MNFAIFLLLLLFIKRIYDFWMHIVMEIFMKVGN